MSPRKAKDFKPNWREEYEDLPFAPLVDRGISQATAEHFGVKVGYDTKTGEVAEHWYPYYNENGELIGAKIRNVAEKKFFNVGNAKEAMPFGWDKVAGKRKTFVIVTEGECDAMAARQIMKMRKKAYNVLSVKDGASLGKSTLAALGELQKFDKVLILFDNDKAGQEGARALAQKLEPGKAFIGRLAKHKDVNEVLQSNKFDDFMDAMFNPIEFRPDGLVSCEGTLDRLLNRKQVDSTPWPEGWVELNRMTYGVRRGELDTWTSGTGMGKSSVLREIQYHLYQADPEIKQGIIALEEPLEDSLEMLMGLHLKERLALPDCTVKRGDKRYVQAWKDLFEDGRFVFYDDFGSMDDEGLIEKIRYMATGQGCTHVILDHLSIVVSEYAAEGGERERIDTIMTRLKKLTQELDIWIGLIVHLRKPPSGKRAFEEGEVPTLADLRGSGSISQLSNGVFALSRNQQAEDAIDRNTTQLHVLKCRFTGRTGQADYLLFDDETGRMDKRATVGFAESEDAGVMITDPMTGEARAKF